MTPTHLYLVTILPWFIKCGKHYTVRGVGRHNFLGEEYPEVARFANGLVLGHEDESLYNAVEVKTITRGSPYVIICVKEFDEYHFSEDEWHPQH